MRQHICAPNELYHYGVLGMKWGKRKSALNRQNASDYRDKGYTIAQANRQAKKDDITAKKQTETKKKEEKSKLSTKEKFKKIAAKGLKVASKIAAASAIDDVLYSGQIKKTAGKVIKQTGRRATEAWLYRHGTISVTWLD